MSVLMIIKDKKIEFKSESLFAEQKSFTFFVVKSDSKNIEMNVWKTLIKISICQRHILIFIQAVDKRVDSLFLI